MAAIALNGQIRAEVNHVPVITITRVSIRENKPGTVKKGGYGTIGVAQGIPDYSGSFVLSVPSTGPEIDLESLKASSFTLSWNRGAVRKLATGCQVTSIDDANDPGPGNYDITVNFIAPDCLTL